MPENYLLFAAIGGLVLLATLITAVLSRSLRPAD